MKRSIAIISEHASPLADPGSVDSGGQNVYVAQVSDNLARIGYRIDVFTRRYDTVMPEVLGWKDGIRVIHVPAGPPEFVRKERLLGFMRDFTEYMIAFFRKQDRHYDLIHANFWMSGLVAADIKAALGIPFIITFHALGKVRRQYQGKNDEFPDNRFTIEERIVREADGIVAECPQDQCDLMDLYGANPGKIRQIPCGFDPKELWPVEKVRAKRYIGVAGNEWIVLQLGRIVPRKGVDTAIRGFARFAGENSANTRLVIVGGESGNPDPVSDAEIGRLSKIAAEEGVLEHVLFAGRRSRRELKYYFSAADVFISAPWYEPFGITPVESMACGTPVIGAAVGGIKYTVMDGETGYLVHPGDPDAIGKYLTELYRNPEKLMQLREHALERVNALFTWQKVGDMLAGFYRDVLSWRTPVIVRRNRNEKKRGKLIEDECLAIVSRAFESAFETLRRSRNILDQPILDASGLIADCLNREGKIMVCGNGGGAADAQHFAAELVGRFMSRDRGGLPVLSLTADSAFLTAWSNDVGYENIFARQVEAFGRQGDLLLAISTSGRSKNLVEAFSVAREMKIGRLALLGGSGGDLLPMSDMALVVPSQNTQRIQEVQILVLHLLCELIEKHINSRTNAGPENEAGGRWLTWVDIQRTKTGV